MKQFISMLIIFVAVTGLCIFDGVYTNRIFVKLEHDSKEIETTLKTEQITNSELQEKIYNLNDFWTKKMDTLAISISRKDLQPVSDYLQYLVASIQNESQEDAITYSHLLSYNIEGLHQSNGIRMLNLL